MYVVIGATGNTGKIVANSLIAAGKKVRITGRSAERADELICKGAEFLKGDLAYVEFPAERLIQAMMAMGASENMGQRMATFLEVANTGRIMEGVVRDAESATATSIEEFTQTFAHAYNM